MAEVLDYSAGWPAPAAIRAAHYVGVVRYIGTPGRSKNLTRAEAQAMHAAGIPIALVYEDAAAWMRGGAPAGAAAARAALADAKSCGVGVRCVYLACDEDITNTAMMQTVQKCLDGAAGVLGRGRVGVYGEADVIDACLGQRHATFGWQTRAWSGGRVSTRAHLLQQVGYVYPDGVQSDRSTVLKPDWGQWPDPNGDDVSAPDVWAYKIPYPSYGADLPHAKPAYSAGEYLAGLSVTAGRLLQRLDAQTAATSALAGLLASGQTNLTAADVEAAVERAITANLSHSTADADPNPAS